MKSRSADPAWRIFALGALALLSGCLQLHAKTMLVSVPVLHLQENERIVAFEIRIRSGRIAQLPNVPIGWTISVDNDPSWSTRLKGSIAVGAAALSADVLQHFIVVETESGAPSDMPFALDGEVVVTSDFKAERTIHLSAMDFLTEVEPQVLIKPCPRNE